MNHVMCVLVVLLLIPVTYAHAAEELTIIEENRQYVAQAMVEQMMRAFEKDKEGALSMMHDVNNPLFRDGNVYGFVIDADGVLLAHTARPDLVGLHMQGLIDLQRTDLGALFAEHGSPHGKWVLYEWTYPSLGLVGPIKAWLVTGWGHTFGAAIHVNAYPDIDVYLTERDRERQDVAKAMVRQTIESFSQNTSLAISMIHNPDSPLFHDREVYPIIIHNNGTLIAHGNNPRLAGTDMDTLEDSLGANLGELFERNYSTYGRWVDYYWPNPSTSSNSGELQIAWINSYGDYHFAAGIYPEDPDTDNDDMPSHHDASRKRAATEMIQTAIRVFGQDPDMAISLIHDKDDLLFHDAELYLIVAYQDGTVVAHGDDSSLAGSNSLDIHYDDGTTLWDILESGSPYGSWFEHDTIHHIDGRHTIQNTLVVRHGGYVFAVGTYPQYQPDHYPDLTINEREMLVTAQSMVESAAESFILDPAVTISRIHEPSDKLFWDQGTFVSIIHRNGTVIAHGHDSAIAGTDIEYIRDSRGTSMNDIIESNVSIYGRWVDYYWPDPATRFGEDAHTLVWYKLFGEYIFGAGTYPQSIQ